MLLPNVPRTRCARRISTLCLVLPACLSTINNNGRGREAFELAGRTLGGSAVPEAGDDDTLDAGISSRVMCPDVTLLTATRRVR